MDGRSLAALSLAALVLARPLALQEPTDTVLVAELDDLAGDLRARLVAAPAAERPALLEELVLLEQELRRMLPGDDALHLALYKTLAARAELDERAPLDERLARFDEAIAMAELCGLSEPHARAWLLKAECLALHGRHAAARATLHAALERVPDQVGTRAFTHFALAEVEARLGSYASALQELERALAACLEGEAWERLRGRVAGTRGQVFLDLGLIDRAAEAFALEARALDAAGALPAAPWKDLVAADLHAVHLALAQRRWTRAVSRADEALARLGSLQPTWSAVLEAVRAEALGRMADRDPALVGTARQAFERALSGALPERDRLLAEVRRARLETLAAEHASARALLADARSRLERLRAESGGGAMPEEALLATEEARLALALGGSRAALEQRLVALERAFGERLALWNETPLLASGLGFLQPPARRSWLWALTRLALAVDGPERGAERALGLWMRAQAQGVLVRGRALAAGTPAEARALLCAARRGVAVYLCAPEGSFVALLDQAGASIVELAPESELFELGELGASDGALARALLPAQLERCLARWTELSVVGFELLGRVAFEELATADGRALGAHWALSYLPSLPLGLWLADPAAHAAELGQRQGCALVAAPRPGPLARARWSELAPLELSGALLAELADAAGAGAVLVHGEEATPARLLALGSSARVLQVLAHGVRAEEREEPALLLLTPDARHPEGWIGAQEILGLRAPELVLLTACASGRGPQRRGDAASGSLAGAFLAAGARCVLASEEDLPLGPTLDFSVRFHRALGAGRTPAEALRGARSALARELGSEALGGLATLRALGWAHRPLVARSGAALPRARSSGALFAGGLACALVALVAGLRARRLRPRAR